MKAKSERERILVSACLLGIGCRFDAEIKDYQLGSLLDKAICFPLCPEIMAGFSMPRDRVEIRGGDGEDVLSGEAKIFTQKGIEVTDKIIGAARVILEFCRSAGIKKAVLKEKSPCCAKKFIYDGSFGNKIIEGKGVVTALLQREGIKVFNEKEVSF